MKDIMYNVTIVNKENEVSTMTYTIKEFIEKLKSYNENERVYFNAYEVDQDKIEVEILGGVDEIDCTKVGKRMFIMRYTVKELIEKLKLFDENEEIYFDAYNIGKNKIEVEMLVGFDEIVYCTIEKRG